MTKGLDCASTLTTKTAKALKSLGFQYAARYLGPASSWKTFDSEEAAVILSAGLKLISIYQKSNNNIAYFSFAQGKKDAAEAEAYAKAVGQPLGTAIYFAVDFSAQSSHMSKILDFVEGVKAGLKDYQVGIYGNYNVMQAIKGKVDYYWQTYAWSNGKVADFIHMHQYENDVKVAGVAIDRNDINKDPGDWSYSVVDAPQEDVKVEIITTPSKPAATKRKKGSDGTYTVVSGDTLGEIGADFGISVDDLVKWNGIGNKHVINIGVKLVLSAPKASNSTSKTSGTKKITIQKGDTLSGLAAKHDTSVAKLKSLNGYRTDTIYAGKIMIVPTSSSTAAQASAAKTYTVKKDENATKIAKKLGVSLAKLKELNPKVKDWDVIHPGDVLRCN